jgi:hypothetical protein
MAVLIEQYALGWLSWFRIYPTLDVDRGLLSVSWFRIYPTLDVDRGLLSGLHAGR